MLKPIFGGRRCKPRIAAIFLDPLEALRSAAEVGPPPWKALGVVCPPFPWAGAHEAPEPGLGPALTAPRTLPEGDVRLRIRHSSSHARA